jgi:hypothetical protein
MLFVSGARDALADLRLLTAVVAGLGKRASLHVVDGANHSFRFRQTAVAPLLTPRLKRLILWLTGCSIEPANAQRGRSSAT